MPTTRNQEYVMPETIAEELKRLERIAERSRSSEEVDFMKEQIRDLAYAIRYRKVRSLDVHTNYLRGDEKESRARQSISRHVDSNYRWTLCYGGRRGHYVLEIDFRTA